MPLDRTHPPPLATSPCPAPTSPVEVGASVGDQPRRLLLEFARSPLPLAGVAVRALVRRTVGDRRERTIRVAGVLGVASLAVWGALQAEVEPTASASFAEARAGSGRPLVEAFGEIRTAVVRARSDGAFDTDSLLRTDRPYGLASEALSSVRAVGRPPVSAASPSPSGRPGRPVVAPRRRRRPVLPSGLPVGFPVRGSVSSPFGARVHPVTRRVWLHRGIDLAVPLGTPVVATASGRVLSVGSRGGYGLAVEVGHSGPGGLVTSTLYAHLSAVPVGLRVGGRVRRHSVVGYSGGVGPRAGISTGPHVHYEVRLRGTAVDPVSVAEGVRVWRSVPARAAVRRPPAGPRRGARAGRPLPPV